MLRSSLATSVIATLALVACSADPGAPLIPTPERMASVSPSQVAPVRADGFPNILADPATAPGLVRPAARNEADQADLEARGRQLAAATRGLAGPSNAAALAARGRQHVADAKREIEAGARPQEEAPPPSEVEIPTGSEKPESLAEEADLDTTDPVRKVAPDFMEPPDIGPSFDDGLLEQQDD
ncbi:flagellar biosynthesis protein FlhF [Acuticoccus mangrovi]|uniref:DUF3035 domain-containing protein n=1 Tax=Acuticoccus mangrovi TaxID=2796142 RepID=A0A934IR50_9HYPH|nr:hypothetical protein [Acuticoccus mangrovi]MBJ3776535.1 hypothetical protein [Acuticoccus mangrovi]